LPIIGRAVLVAHKTVPVVDGCSAGWLFVPGVSINVLFPQEAKYVFVVPIFSKSVPEIGRAVLVIE
jgi:hypothetical protein